MESRNHYGEMKSESGRLIRTIQIGVLLGIILTAILSF